jgi:hypothetical protein
VKETVISLPAPPSRVFPLLCPERERDWIEGWDYTMMYSESGYAEPGCVFVSTLPPEGRTIWEFLEHVPDRRIAILRVSPDLVTIRWEMELTEPGAGRTDIHVRWIVTGLSSDGNRYIDEELDGRFAGLMAWLEKLMDYYLRTGRPLPARS